MLNYSPGVSSTNVAVYVASAVTVAIAGVHPENVYPVLVGVSHAYTGVAQ